VPSMIEKLVRATVSAAEQFGHSTVADLFPEEQAVIARAVPARRNQFTTGRRCARTALAGLGLSPVPIMPGPGGAPQWPAGVVGSITHTAGYAASAVAWAHEVRTIGLDAEPHDPLPAGVLEMVAHDEERARLAELAAASPSVPWDRVLFSAKESVYKAWYPLTLQWLEFEDISVTINPAAMTFIARLLLPDAQLPADLAAFAGRCMLSRDLILTSATALS
jgi:4'-phosphopantetheinyl transferase EntD